MRPRCSSKSDAVRCQTPFSRVAQLNITSGSREAESWALPQNRFRRLEYCHFEGACRKETRPLRKVASGASHRELNNGFHTPHAAPRTSVYTPVYTGVENSGLLGPHASKRSHSETALTKRICPALPTWDLLRPQPPKLFANETLYQLSYTPNIIDFRELHINISGARQMLVCTVMTSTGITML